MVQNVCSVGGVFSNWRKAATLLCVCNALAHKANYILIKNRYALFCSGQAGIKNQADRDGRDITKNKSQQGK